MKILNNVVTVAQEVTVETEKWGKSIYRPILVNGKEMGRAFRYEKTVAVDGKNITEVKWMTSKKHPVTVNTAGKMPIVTSINQEGKEYQEVPVEGEIPAGLQIKAFPSQFKAGQARLAITVYSEYQD